TWASTPVPFRALRFCASTADESVRNNTRAIRRNCQNPGPVLACTFWMLLLVGAYPYVVYPVLVAQIGRLCDRKVRSSDTWTPRVTVITAAYNEADHIEACVRNKLAQEYPAELLDV